MPRFSEQSHQRLATCHPDLQRLFQRVILQFDCVVLEGVRTEEQQRQYVERGVSKTMQSKHLRQPDGFAHAVDVVPYPIDWQDRNRMYYFGGYVLGIAEGLGIPIRWGADWDRDTHVKDTQFIDLPHFELISAHG